MKARSSALRLVALAALAALSACDGDECGNVACAPCAPFATIRVTDAATGEPVEGVAVAGGAVAWACALADGATVCQATPPAGSAFDVEVGAPGYATATAHVAPAVQDGGACCGDCLVYLPLTVELSPVPPA